MSNRQNTSDGLAYYWVETTPGVLPGGAPKTLRWTGEGFSYNPTLTGSEEIGSRQVLMQEITQATAGGDLKTEMPYGAHDDFWNAILQAGGFSTDLAISDATISAASSDSSFSCTTANLFQNIKANSWIQMSGWTGGSASLNGFHWVSQVVSSTKIIVVPESGVAIVTAALGPTISIIGGYARNASVPTSFSVYILGQTITHEALYLGQYVDTIDLTVSQGQFIKAQIGFKGIDANYFSTGSPPVVSGATIVSSRDPVTAARALKAIRLAGVAGSALPSTPGVIDIKEIQLKLKNSAQEDHAATSVTPIGIGFGDFEAEGTISAYAEDMAFLQKSRAGTVDSFGFRVTDVLGNSYIIDLAALKWGNVKQNFDSKNKRLMASAPFKAYRSSALGWTMQMSRFTVL